MMNPISQVFADPDGDVDLVIQGYVFVVSSSKMSAISPEFQKVFTSHDSLLRKTVELQNENAIAFHLVCQLAHVAFIPEAHISLETLVKLADIIRRFEIHPTSSIHEAAVFCFNERTRILDTISTTDLVVFLQVAKDLGSSVYAQLLEDAFLLHSSYLEALPTESNLRYLKLKGVACRIEVAKILSNPTAESLDRNYLLFKWILLSGSNLRTIKCQLNQEIAYVLGQQLQQLLDARSAIDQAIEDVGSYIRCRTQPGVPELGSYPTVRRLKVHMAYAEEDTGASSPASSPAMSPATSAITEFEDIDAYSTSIEEQHAPRVQDDNVSIKSCPI